MGSFTVNLKSVGKQEQFFKRLRLINLYLTEMKIILEISQENYSFEPSVAMIAIICIYFNYNQQFF